MLKQTENNDKSCQVTGHNASCPLKKKKYIDMHICVHTSKFV